MRRMNITVKIWSSIGVFVVGTLVAVGIGQIQAMVGEGRLAETSAVLFPAAQRGQEAAALFERTVKGFGDAVLLEDQSALDQARQDGAAAAGALRQAAGLTGQSATRGNELGRLADAVNVIGKDAVAAYGPVVAAAGSLTPELMAPVQKLGPRIEELQKALADNRDALAGDLQNELAEAVRRSMWQRRIQMAVFLAALALSGVVVTLTIRRAVVLPIRAMVDELALASSHVSQSSSQVSGAAQSLSQGATEQAASLEETSASMEEISAMTRTNADNSQQAASLMGDAARVLDQSNQSLADMVTAMTSIKASSNSVSKIIKTIDEIAFQTNILALNAAVEAARAGEAGMGFAVVADEVRSLAQRSAQAARDTTALIEGAIASSTEGSQKVAQAAESFAAITHRVTEVKRLVDNVSVASGQQAHGIEQVLQTIRQMEKVTQTTAATAEESAAASEQLNAQAGVTMRLVQRLEAMVDRAYADAPIAPLKPVVARPDSRITTLIPSAARAHRSTVDAGHGAASVRTGTFGQF
jgi:methyl-accepting chemotaxis protein